MTADTLKVRTQSMPAIQHVGTKEADQVKQSEGDSRDIMSMTRTGRNSNEAPLKTVAFNCHGLKGSFNSILPWLSDIDVMFLSETWMHPCELSF